MDNKEFHGVLIKAYWDTIHFGSYEDTRCALCTLECFEREGLSKGFLKEEDIFLKYVLNEK